MEENKQGNRGISNQEESKKRNKKEVRNTLKEV
jgi:hypothetical protein